MKVKEVLLHILEHVCLVFQIFTCSAVRKSPFYVMALLIQVGIGPNTATGHTSVIFTEEVQVGYLTLV
jgi:hypothetical protein